MSIKDNTRLDDEFIAAWDAHDVDRALALLSDEIIWHDGMIPEPMRGKSAVRPYLQSWFAAFPDLKTVVHRHVVSEDQLAAEVEFTGTNTGPLQVAPGAPAIPATGRPVRGRGTYFVRFEGGKAAEIRSYPDAAGLMTQLGLMPAN